MSNELVELVLSPPGEKYFSPVQNGIPPFLLKVSRRGQSPFSRLFFPSPVIELYFSLLSFRSWRAPVSFSPRAASLQRWSHTSFPGGADVPSPLSSPPSCRRALATCSSSHVSNFFFCPTSSLPLNYGDARLAMLTKTLCFPPSVGHAPPFSRRNIRLFLFSTMSSGVPLFFPRCRYSLRRFSSSPWLSSRDVHSFPL